MRTSKKKPAPKKRGRPRGSKSPRQGSGLHPLDAEWHAKGYLTVREAADVAGIPRTTLYHRIEAGRLQEGRDYTRVNGTLVYVRREAAEAIRASLTPPKDAA